jgi:hypothetical protein
MFLKKYLIDFILLQYMDLFNCLDNNINIHILLYLNRKDFMKTRILSKRFKNIGNHDIFWRIVNFTDTRTVDEKQLYEQFKHDNYLHVYNLSQKSPNVISIPRGLLTQLCKTRLIII